MRCYYEIMSATLPELSPIPLPDEKPSNRGKFSPDRDYWAELHRRRYLQWQLGTGIEEIAAEEGVTYNAVKHSILWCEGHTSRDEVLAGRATRLRLQAFARLSERYLDELENLMSDPNPILRSRALEHYRKTIGLEVGAGVHVNVNQAFVHSAQPSSFEQAMDRIRELHQRESQVISPAVPSTGPARSDSRPRN